MSQDNKLSPEPVAVEDTDRYFRTDHLKANLGARTARSGVVVIGAQALKFVISMATTIILARLLTPQDYGLIGMVIVVMGFISMFKDMGLSLATVQREEINHAQISALFWLNVAISMTVMLLTAALAPAIAWFYGEPRLTVITIVLAGTFIFGGLTVQHQALLQRQMRFTTLAAIDLASLLIGVTTGILFAWYGARYWALVLSQLATSLTNVVGVWVACGWRPGLPQRTAGVRSMLALGGNLTAFSIVNYLARNLDNALIGRVWGAYELGLYAKAYQLLLLPIDQINGPTVAVAVPALSRLVDSPERYRQAYLRILEKLTIICMPGVAFMIASSDWLVRLVLGPQWSGVSRIFMLLGIAGLIQPVTSSTGLLFTTQGRTKRMFQVGGMLGLIAIAAIIAGLPWGAIGVAASYATVDLLVRAPLLFWLIGREGPVRTMDFYRTMAPAAIVAVGVLLALFTFRYYTHITNPAAGLAIALAITLTLTIVLLAILPQGRLALLDFKSLIPLLTKRSPSVQL